MLTIEQINVFKKCSEWLEMKKMNIRYCERMNMMNIRYYEWMNAVNECSGSPGLVLWMNVRLGAKNIAILQESMFC